MMNKLDFLLHGPEQAKSSFRWATVTAVNPVRVRFDGDTTATPATPTSLVPVVVGDRAWIQLHGRMMVIVGRLQTASGSGGGGPYAVAGGVVTVPVGGNWTTITFPAGRFTRTPVVTATVQDGSGAAQGVVIRLNSPSTSGVTIHLTDVTGTVAESAVISWIAVQVTA